MTKISEIKKVAYDYIVCNGVELKLSKAVLEMADVIEEMKAALEFYENKSNWVLCINRDYDDSYGLISHEDLYHQSSGLYQIGGLHALKCLESVAKRIEI